MHWVLPLVTLTLMEVVLGVDNIVFLSVLLTGIPEKQRGPARWVGLTLALGARIGLLVGLRWVMGLERPLFRWSSLHVLPPSWVESFRVDTVTFRDVVLLGGGMFLITKSVLEIHKNTVVDENEKPRKPRSMVFPLLILEIVVLDVVFSLDSVISAIGMAKDLWIMITAMLVAVTLMAVFSGKVAKFIEANPTLNMLALSFLVMIGVMLFSEGLGTPIHKGYVYVAMLFALGVEMLNMIARRRRKSAKLRRAAGR